MKKFKCPIVVFIIQWWLVLKGVVNNTLCRWYDKNIHYSNIVQVPEVPIYSLNVRKMLSILIVPIYNFVLMKKNFI